MVNASTERTPSRDNAMTHGRRALNPTLGSITPPTGTGATTLGVGGKNRTIVVTIVVTMPPMVVVIVVVIVVARGQFDAVT
jgi:hypothetical protein